MLQTYARTQHYVEIVKHKSVSIKPVHIMVHWYIYSIVELDWLQGLQLW